MHAKVGALRIPHQRTIALWNPFVFFNKSKGIPKGDSPLVGCGAKPHY